MEHCSYSDGVKVGLRLFVFYDTVWSFRSFDDQLMIRIHQKNCNSPVNMEIVGYVPHQVHVTSVKAKFRRAKSFKYFFS